MNTPTDSKELPLNHCSVLLDLAIRWEAQAEIHDAEGDADYGTGSDVPYAMASILREHAQEIERLAYIFQTEQLTKSETEV
jgi:hypothetical protein